MSATTGSRPVAPPRGVTPPLAACGHSTFLSDVVVELGFADREAVEQAVRTARNPGTTLARVLVESGAIDEQQLARATAERHGIAYVDLDSFAVEPPAANLLKPELARRYRAVPVGFVGGGLLLAMADPADALGVSDIARITAMDVKPAVAARPALEALLAALPLGPEAEGAEPAAQRDPAADYAASAQPVAGAPPEPAAGTQPPLDLALPAPAVPTPPSPAADGLLRAELERMRERANAAESALDQAHRRARDAENAAAMARAEAAESRAAEAALRHRVDELEGADRRAEAARQALSQLREENERQLEQAAIRERYARAQLGETEDRRGALEEHLAEVESSAFASERAFEDMREAQGRMRSALRSLAGEADR